MRFNSILAALLLLAGCLGAPATGQATQEVSSPRERINLDKGWRFAYGHAGDPARDFGYGLRPFFFAKAGYGDGPADPSFSDLSWRSLDLPHDWAVELPFSSRGNTNHGSKAIGLNFPENSVGWYRKEIDLPTLDRGRRITLEFDGVYRDSVVWVNGHYIGREPSGYSGFRYDVTDYLNYGGRNVIAVRVDATGEEGWFYEGAGLYRHVWLTKTDPLHVAQWGTFVKSTILGADARIDVEVTLANDAKQDAAFSLRHEIVAPDGQIVASSEQGAQRLGAASNGDFSTAIYLRRAQLWSTETPHLYVLRTTILRGAQAVDRYETRFGIRSVTWDPEKGFFLNGKNIKLQGTNNHQDHAGIGVALPDGLQAWRLKQLKSFGVNAYRTSHHPPTPELLDEADRLGILVIDEHRMMGTTPEIRGQLERLIRRDRNHPSVVLWSIGNEEWALEWEPLGTRLAIEMDDIVKRLDPTRRTSIATSGSGKGVSVGADVIGFNYGAQHDVDAFHRQFPDKPALMSEEGSTLSTRAIYIDDRDAVHLNAYDRQGRPGLSLSIEEGWRRVAERPWMSGMFVWTGFDYRGETTPFGWPAISSQFGMLDTTGVLKDTAYYLRSVWTYQPMVHILPHWNWPGREGQPVDVRVYSNGDAVELFLNGKSLGRQSLPPNSHLKWSVPYQPGALTARAFKGGKEVAIAKVETTGASARIKLTPDKASLEPDGTDISVVWVNVTDAQGRIVPLAQNEIRFSTTGPIRIIGVGNGDPASHEADRAAERHTLYAIPGWRSRAVDDFQNRPEIAPDVDVSGWRDPLAWLPPESQPPLSRGLVLRGTFVRPPLASGNQIDLFVQRLRPDQRIYINGKPVVPEERQGALVIGLDASELRDINSVSYLLDTPEGGVPALADRSVNGSRWGILRVTTPAAPWQRSVFNGWAQVIVQTIGRRGRATLTATGTHLRTESAEFDVR